MKTLEEVIRHHEEVAEEYCEKVEDGLTADDFCDSCASEHRQLAEWLKELKNYRKREFCHYCEERDTLIYDEPCKSCKIYFVRKEVNADE